MLGLLVGSFLNVVIYRVPIMLNREWRTQCAELAAEDAATASAVELPAELPAAAPVAGTGAEQATFPFSETVAPPAVEVVSRLPEKFNLVVPRSACPSCGRQIHALENIPVISWLFLRGKCAGCGASISWRYPFVELLTGVMSAAVAWKLGLGWPVVGALVFTWLLIALTFIDFDTQLLPDNMTLPLVWLGLFASVVLPALGAPPTPGEPMPPSLRDSVIGAIAGYMSLWLVYHAFRLATGKEGMGYGDFKLLAAIGAWLGWQMVLPTILLSAAVGAVSGLTIHWLQKKDHSVPIAFGPFLALAGWIMLMFGHDIVSRYLNLFPQ